MAINSRVSKKTLLFASNIVILGVLLAITVANAGTVGTPEAERSRLEEELASARNALDALVLQPGMKLDDPRVREKSAQVEEKKNAYQKTFEDAQNGPPKPAFYPNKTPDRPNGERDEKEDMRNLPPVRAAVPMAPAPAAPVLETSTAPEIVLSGDGIQKEITYSKKRSSGKPEKPVPKLSPRFGHTEEAVPVGTATPNAEGLSEIEYPKKKKGN